MTAHEKIVVGKTTRDEVRQLYGKPSNSSAASSGLSSDRWEFYNLTWPVDRRMFFVLVNYQDGVVRDIVAQLTE
jgi:hypothetical protein